MRKIAVFDIDGTIFRSSLLIELVDALIQEWLFPKETTHIYSDAYQKWLDRHGEYEAYIKAVVDAYMHYICGVDYDRHAQVARGVVAFHKNRTYRYTRDLVGELKNSGYYMLAISHSPKSIVQEFCAAYGFDKVYGSVWEIDEAGKFTGSVPDWDFLRKKENILARAIEKENLSLEDSYGVGDSESDIGFLERVARPICFNPSRALYEHARRAGWQVLIERKDMIYKL